MCVSQAYATTSYNVVVFFSTTTTKKSKKKILIDSRHARVTKCKFMDKQTNEREEKKYAEYIIKKAKIGDW